MKALFNTLVVRLVTIWAVGFAIWTAEAALTHLMDEKPVAVTQVSPDVILVDFGRAAYGNVRLLPSAGASGEVQIHFGEDLVAGRINRKPPGTVRYNLAQVTLSGQQSIVAAPPPDARNTELIPSAVRPHPPAILTPPEWGVVLPFRWVEIEGWKGALRPEQIVRQTAYASTWDDDAAAFACSDEMLNKIWELCRYSIKATTFAGIYVDGDGMTAHVDVPAKGGATGVFVNGKAGAATKTKDRWILAAPVSGSVTIEVK